MTFGDDNPIRLRAVSADDRAVVASWFGSPAEVALFAGDSAAWPLTPERLELDDRARHDRPASTSMAAVVDGGFARGRLPGASFVGGETFVSETLVGHVTLRGLGTEHVHLARIAVAPAFRGRGIASPLVTRAVAFAEEAGATWLTLYVVPGNEPALRAYRRAGFSDAGVDPAHPEYVWMTRGVAP